MSAKEFQFVWVEGLGVLGWFQDGWAAVRACAVCLRLTPRVVPARAPRRNCAPCVRPCECARGTYCVLVFVICVEQLLAILASYQCLEHICLVVFQGFGHGGTVRVVCGGRD